MKAPALIFALALACTMGAQTVDGIPFRVQVVNKLTGTPVASASVVLYDENDQRVFGRTDAGGKFEGSVTKPGKYMLTVSRKGYSMSEMTLGKLVEISPGVSKEITVQMSQLGVIAGRVLDQFGDPIRGAVVRSIDRRRSPSSSDDGYDGFSVGITDDLGEYRISEVQPGRHYVAVEFDSENNDRFSGSRMRFRWPQIGGFTFYPNTTKIEDAQQVEVSSGQATRVGDLRLNMRRSVTVSGRVVPPPLNRTGSVQLEPAGGRLGLNVTAGRGGTPQEDGSFSLSILPGSWLLHSYDGKTGKMSQSMTIEVADKSITGIELKLQSGYEIAGRIVVDGQEALDFSKLHLSLLGPDDKIGSNGIFHANLSGNKGFFILQGLPEGWYIEDVSLAGKHIRVGQGTQSTQFDVQPGTSDLSVIVSPRAARLEVTVEPASDHVEVVLIPADESQPEFDSMRPALRDPNGHFVLASLPPGTYRVFTVDGPHMTMLFAPNLLVEKYGKSAPVVNVAERDHKSIVVPPTKFEPE